MDFNITFKKKAVVMGLTGYAQSGKDTAAAFLVEQGWTRLSFADILRQSLYNLNPIIDHWCSGPEDGECIAENWRVQFLVDEYGWDYCKVQYPEIRELLQRFGTDVGRTLYGDSFWVDRVANQIVDGGKYVISDVRFPNEAKMVHDLGGQVWRIRRDGTGAVNSHISDTGIDSLTIDGAIPNGGTLDHFRDLVLLAAGIRLD